VDADGLYASRILGDDKPNVVSNSNFQRILIIPGSLCQRGFFSIVSSLLKTAKGLWKSSILMSTIMIIYFGLYFNNNSISKDKVLPGRTIGDLLAHYTPHH
jgi:hypothetical protein